MLISNTTVFARNDKCPVRQIGNGLVIMAPEGNLTHSLQDIGAFIWDQLDGKNSLAAVLDAITGEYAVDRETAETDLQNFVSELLAAGVIVQKP